jgi:small GTP-binding protein
VNLLACKGKFITRQRNEINERIHAYTMDKLVIGILAHVDAGKTTLSESILYLSGKLGRLGRVDNKDAYLDTFDLEKERGITIFSKQAVFEQGNTQITLLDTPGHVDFSAEMERTLQVLDYAILVISGADGVQGHTKTLWSLLHMYQIPVMIFINKMDQAGTDKATLMKEMKEQLQDNCVEFGEHQTEEFYDQLAMCDYHMMESYLEKGSIDIERIKTAIMERKVFPCFFGSALKLEGVENLLKGIQEYATNTSYPMEFGAKIYKVTRDEQGNRLTHMKVTGGALKVKDMLSNGVWEEKVNQIRIYSGQKYEAVSEVSAGTICAVTGLSLARPGEGLGIDTSYTTAILEPVLFYQLIPPKGCEPRVLLPKLRELEEEEPELHILWQEELQEIQVQIMGEVQLEILQTMIENRFGIVVEFGAGKIVYKETIETTVEGVGHFEPLRHYAEVHLLLEPGDAGSGLEFLINCSEDILGKSWQKLVLSHLEEKDHRGVLTGSSITDMKITLVSGRAHNKHTEGGDFREATYRAVRQGLMEAKSVLLEPFYNFQLELPREMVGRAMTDIEKMYGVCELTDADGDMTRLTGSGPVVTMRNYQQEVTAYTKGYGRMYVSLKGYGPCHNQEEVIRTIGYEAERDLANPSSSIFCAGGAGYLVNWFEVKDSMHMESYLQQEKIFEEVYSPPTKSKDDFISTEEIDRILSSTYYANQGKKTDWMRTNPVRETYYASSTSHKPKITREEYLLVDGYNIIFAWQELAELAGINMDGARTRLLDILSNYQGIRKCPIIVVFDAYRVQDHKEEMIAYHNIYMVYTREAQTADQYIEKFAHENQSKYQVVVATSDGLQQIIVRGAGALLLSARELEIEIREANERMKQGYEETKEKSKQYLLDGLSDETKKQLGELADS